jgi:hypothetical protein
VEPPPVTRPKKSPFSPYAVPAHPNPEFVSSLFPGQPSHLLVEENPQYYRPAPGKERKTHQYTKHDPEVRTTVVIRTVVRTTVVRTTVVRTTVVRTTVVRTNVVRTIVVRTTIYC